MHAIPPLPAAPAPSDDALGLGLDAGGTQTRWALATASGELVAEGSVPGLSATQFSTAEGRDQLVNTLGQLAHAVRPFGGAACVHAGLTGYTPAATPASDTLANGLRALIGGQLGLPADRVDLVSDVEVAYRDVFQPGQGYLVYAGTGSIGVFVDSLGTFHRVGGRGGLLDDAGSGFWIARTALRHIWRAEDETPGAWRDSPMAREVLEHVGGSEWAHTRQFLSTADRGEVGRLALAVASAAGSDPAALQILQEAGTELGRLARILIQRYGPRPLVLSGRVFQLHPAIEQLCRAALTDLEALHALTPVAVRVQVSRGHHAAARIAAARLLLSHRAVQVSACD